MSDDDREEFEQAKVRQASAMAQDAALQACAHEFFVSSDRYDWSYQWTWLGLPVIQVPTDIVASQEIVWRHRPTLVIECGVARGGSLIFWASMLQLIGDPRGTVLGIDVDIRAHNRAAIEDHPLAHRIRLVQSSSIDPQAVTAAAELATEHDAVMVVLDSNHTHEHVLAELNAYAALVTPGQYLIVSDTCIENMPVQAHRPRSWGPGNNPATAVSAFLADHPEFEVDRAIDQRLLISSTTGGYLRRR